MSLPVCGTYAGYQRHKKRGEPVDDECRLARNAYMAAYRASSARVREADRGYSYTHYWATKHLISRHLAEFHELLAIERRKAAKAGKQ